MLIIGAVIGSFCRVRAKQVFLGAHYPSDCVVGSLLGTIILILSYSLYQFPLGECPSCIQENCYGSLRNLSEFEWYAMLPGLVVVCVGTLIAVVITLPPLSFWNKSSYVLG